MLAKKDFQRVQQSLQNHLRERFEDAEVTIGENIHYKGVNVVVTSAAFKGLLAEQRFHHVGRAIPKDFYEEHLQRGVVWFELAPGETGQDLMKMPRSSDVKNKQDEIKRRLHKAKFFEKLQAKFASNRQSASVTDFSATRQLLKEAGLNEQEITDACLFLMLNTAYSDAQVLVDLSPKMSAESAA